MFLKKWRDLPDEMQCREVWEYYEILAQHKGGLVLKRVFDILASLLLIVILFLPSLILAIAIAIDSPGGIFFRQNRITAYGKLFRIFKFRTMVFNAESLGTQVTTKHDMRVTRVGKLLRRYRFDEFPQLLNVLRGDMTFVGTRPEVIKYVERYTDEMLATFLLPAGITSEASIYYKDESYYLVEADNVDKVYVEDVLPRKMYYNLKAIEQFSFWREIGTMIKTVLAVLGKNFEDVSMPETDKISSGMKK